MRTAILDPFSGISGDMTTFRDPVHMYPVQQQQISALTRLQYIRLLENKLTNVSPLTDWSTFQVLREIDLHLNLLGSTDFLAGMNLLEVLGFLAKQNRANA